MSLPPGLVSIKLSDNRVLVRCEYCTHQSDMIVASDNTETNQQEPDPDRLQSRYIRALAKMSQHALGSEFLNNANIQGT